MPIPTHLLIASGPFGPRLGAGAVVNAIARGVRDGGLPAVVAGDEQVGGRVRAEVAGGGREFGVGDGRDRTERHDLAVRVLDGGADHRAAVLEDEHVGHVVA